jgi:hypothetical protein
MNIFRQGDVLIIEDDKKKDVSNMRPIPRDNGRVVLAYGEVTGHAHAIADSACSLYVENNSPSVDPNQLLGMFARGGGGGLTPDRTLMVEPKETVTLQHEEHDPIALSGGTEGKSYTIRHQIEYDPELRARQVAD